MSNPVSPATPMHAEAAPLWVTRSRLLWQRRTLLGRVLLLSSIASLSIAFLIPKQYTASARIMPPDQGSSSSLLLAALAGRGSSNLGALGGFAGDLLGAHSTTALFLDLLRSGTVTGQVIDHFELQHVYRKRYRVDTAKLLAKRTSVSDDKKSGVITISVKDTDPNRARDMVQAYLNGLNGIVTATNISSARQERIFIEARLSDVKRDLEAAQLRLSRFSSSHNTVDIREQTHAMVDAGGRVQGELLAEQAGLQSLLQVYGDQNVRVRSAQARISALQQDLKRLAGSPGTPDPEPSGGTLEAPITNAPRAASERSAGELYPPLRRLPGLAVPYADLVREVRVKETVYELLTQQYELARLEEVKTVPVVKVIDPPGIPEKKSFPPRLWLSLGLTALCFVVACTSLLFHNAWQQMSDTDPLKLLVTDAVAEFHVPFSSASRAREIEVP